MYTQTHTHAHTTHTHKSSLNAQELAQLLEEAKALPRETFSSITATCKEHDLNTTHRQDYTPKDMSGTKYAFIETSIKPR